MNQLYDFVYRGMLTEESLDKAGRRRRRAVGAEEVENLGRSLSFDMLDRDLLTEAQRMSVVYTGVHAFENTVRQLVKLKFPARRQLSLDGVACSAWVCVVWVFGSSCNM